MLPRLRRTLVVMLWVCGALRAAGSPGIWLDVPFVPQEKDGCGAASVAMVMQYWQRQQGLADDPGANAAQIQRALYSDSAHGIYASGIERYFQQNGYRTFAIRGEWEDLKQQLEKGRPLIAALKPGSRAPLHYVVVTGLDWQQGLVVVNDPALRKLLKEDRARFEQEWSAAGKWTLLAVPQTAAR